LRAEGFSFSPSLRFGLSGSRNGCGERVRHTCEVMPDVDVPLTEITRAKRLAAAMVDTALRKRFELMVAEFQYELDTVEQRPVSQRSPEKN